MIKILLGSLFLLISSINAVYADSTQWIPGWQQTATMKSVRAGAAMVKIGKRVYMLGGIDGRRFLDSTEFTEIREDGFLGQWQLSTTLNEQRGFFGAVANDNFIYVVGGGNGPNGKHLLNTVERVQVQHDGSLGMWKKEIQTLNLPRRCVKLVIVKNRIYALGGFAGALLDSVESAQINADGTLSKWRIEDKTMILPRYVNAVKKAAGNIYVIGGHRESEGIGIADVEFARLDPQGDILNWKITSPLKLGRYAVSAATQSNKLYALGGLDGAIYVDKIEMSIILKDGNLSAWKDTTPLSSPRANFSSFVHNQRLYILGGTNRDGYYDQVEFADLNENGEPGFWGNAQQSDIYHQSRAKKKETKQLANNGSIVEIIQTKAYSYIKVSGEAGNRWLAAPYGEYSINEKISYSRGLTMTNFFSRSLQRHFEEILFVERVEKSK